MEKIKWIFCLFIGISLNALAEPVPTDKSGKVISSATKPGQVITVDAKNLSRCNWEIQIINVAEGKWACVSLI